MSKPVIDVADKEADKTGRSGSGGLFDLRVLVAGLLFVYGVLLLGAGLVDTASTLSKADGVRINLWEGVTLLVVSACFAGWRWLDKPR